jgi:hypothetical protein
MEVASGAVLERSDPALVAVGGATGQGEGVDSRDQYVSRGFWHCAGQCLGCGQMLFEDI